MLVALAMSDPHAVRPHLAALLAQIFSTIRTDYTPTLWLPTAGCKRLA